MLHDMLRDYTSLLETFIMIFKCNYCNLPVDGRVKYACTLDEYCEYGDHGGKGQSPVSFKWNGFFFILFMTMYIIGFRK